jgi:hypothetical protein
VKRMLANVVATIILSAGLCTASDITYEVNQTLGAGSVVGFLKTDGTTGVIGSANILDWNLELTNGANNYDLLGPLEIGSNSSALIGGTDNLSATSTQLSFNFGATTSGYLWIVGSSYWCLASASADYCDSRFGISAGEEVVINSTLSGLLTSPSFDVIGSVASTSAVPEPSTFALMLIMTGFALVMRKRIPPAFR